MRSALSTTLLRDGQGISLQPTLTLDPTRIDHPEPLANAHRVVFAGFASSYSILFLLELLASPEFTVAGILTSHRSGSIIANNRTLADIATQFKIPFIGATDINAPEIASEVHGWNPDVGIIASFDQIFRSQFLSIPVHGWVNVHPSLLPKYRGAEPLFWTLVNGELTAGISFHRAVERFDEGALLAQCIIPVEKDDTAGRLLERIMTAALPLIPAVLSHCIHGGTSTPQPQSTFSTAPPIGHFPLAACASASHAKRIAFATLPDFAPWIELTGTRFFIRSISDAPLLNTLSYTYPDGTQLWFPELTEQCSCIQQRPDCPAIRDTLPTSRSIPFIVGSSEYISTLQSSATRNS